MKASIVCIPAALVVAADAPVPPKNTSHYFHKHCKLKI